MICQSLSIGPAGSPLLDQPVQQALCSADFDRSAYRRVVLKKAEVGS